ncbi:MULTISPECIES: acetate--CoA ligase family protein [unclassified Streptomyces]|uniref:acetate--CoA ligase family protein n=1 Tax=unclassified Streptomyces TaxID=2593676 RepID=UPI002DD9E1B2|nr:acetate--CoA ligase family protein [Streptomyces sp. NBC_01750]WSA98505.1 acetate--CoA ligase family protein [Streptomyces sp. NBC_01794]WSD36958.1 acetate--CoA ligase family protein [Streptomyces sp. NBC_01750]
MGRDLTALFDPKSVAVVGASNDPAKYGHAVASQALRDPGRRPVHLVNRRGGTVLGRAAATSLAEIGEPVDLVVISVPGPGFEAAVDDALACGARAIVGITAGFAETGPAGLARQRAIADRVRAAGAVLVGPNCLGIADNTTQLYLASDTFAPGDIALLSQSGNLALELQLRCAPHGLGFSRFVSLGNQADVTLVDLVEDCARHEPTRAIAVYAEDFGDGRAFARAAAAAGKPVVLLTAGRGTASARSAQSHTGALTTSSDVVAAACRDAGVQLVSTPREMTVVLAALKSGPRTSGRRTAVFTDGGGHGAIAADATEDAGLEVPELRAAAQEKLRTVLWEQSAVGNPVDLAGMGEQNPGSYADTVGELLATDEVDAVLMTGYFGGYAASENGLGGGGSALAEGELRAARAIVTHRRATPKPLVVQSMYPRSTSCQVLADAGIPVFSCTEDAARALAAMTLREAAGPPGVAPLPPAAAPLADTGYHGVRKLLSAAGVPFPPAREITDEAGLLAAAEEFDGPYVLKALHVLHKSDAGGVALRLADRDALLAAYRDMHARLGAPSYSVEAMADLTDGIELIVGVNRDPQFGPVAMVGLGGVLTEALHDVAFSLAPVPARRAETLLRGLRTAALLSGVRGRPAVDVAAAAAVIERITAVAAAHPEIAELEVNPLLVRPEGVLALDARAVLA